MTAADTLDQVTDVTGESHDRRVRTFRCGDTVDSFAVIARDHIVLIDTMVNLESIGRVVEHIASEYGLGPEIASTRSLLVVNTHGDWDHVWGNGLFAGPEARYPAPIIGHRLAADRMKMPRAVEFMEAFKEEHAGRYDSARLWPPTVQFEGPMRIDAGDLSLELIPTPGHTSDHHAVWIPEIRLLIAGDAAEMPFPLVSDAAGLPSLRASLALMAQLKPKTVLYCHAPGVTHAGLIRDNAAYFDELERRCRTALCSGAVTPDHRATESCTDLIEWKLEDALPSGTTIDDVAHADFYRRGHERAIEVMLEWLETH